jgi:hypothetical protein
MAGWGVAPTVSPSFPELLSFLPALLSFFPEPLLPTQDLLAQKM